MAAKNPHTQLVKEVLDALAFRTDCCVWKNNSGEGKLNGRYVTFGKKGTSDIIGFTSDGFFLALECKTGNATQTKEQKEFQAIVEGFGARYLVVRSAFEAYSYIEALNLP